MPDADEFDVEELRALLRGKAPQPEEKERRGVATPAAPGKSHGLAPRAKAAPAKREGTGRTASKPAARAGKNAKR